MAWELNTRQNNKIALGDIENTTFFNIKRFMSKRASDLLFGQGFVINSKDEKINKFINEILKENEMDGLMAEIAEQVAYYGGVILMINKSETGKFSFTYTTPELLQNISNIEITPFKAVLMLKKVVGLQTYIIRETWTLDTIKRELHIYDNLTKEPQLYDPQRHEIPEELKLKKFEKHNLGFIPFIQIKNRTRRNIQLAAGSEGWDELADDADIKKLALSINFSLQQEFKEKWKGGTRVFASLSATKLQNLKGKQELANFITADYVVETNPLPNQTKSVETLPASFDAAKWNIGWQKEIDLYAIGCGYSPIFGTQQEKTEAETLYSKDNDQRTTKRKRKIYTELLSQLFSKLLVYAKLATTIQDAQEKITIEIKENVVYNKLQLSEFLKNAWDNQQYTHLEIISIQRDITNPDDLKEIQEAIIKDQKEKIAREAEQIEALTPKDEASTMNKPGQGGGIGAAGPNKDADPKAG